MPKGGIISKENKLTIRELMEKGLSRNEAGLCYRLRQVRIERQLSQAELAGILKTGVGSIKHIENGRRPPNIEEIILMHRVFQLPFDWILLGRDGQKGQKK